MRFVADESCDFAVVRALRAAGHDVIAIAEISPRVGDDTGLKLARDDNRVLLTEDTDFGELVYAEGRRNCGVVLFRFSAAVRGLLPAAALDAVNRSGGKLFSQFIVVQPGRIRTGAGNP